MSIRDVLVFTLETGQGLPNSNAYASLVEAENFMDRVLDSYKSAWIAADDFQKEQVLIWATQILDEYIVFPCNAYGVVPRRVSPTQALNFPCYGIISPSGWVMPSNVVPTFMKNASIMLAFELLQNNRIAEPIRGIESASVGPLSIQFSKNASQVAKVIPRSVMSIVSQYGGCVLGAVSVRAIPLYRS